MASRTEVELMMKCETESASSQHAEASTQDQDGSASKRLEISSWTQRTLKTTTRGLLIRGEQPKLLQIGTESPLSVPQTASNASPFTTNEVTSICEPASLTAKSSQTRNGPPDSQATCLRDETFSVSTKSSEIWKFPGSKAWVARESKFPVPSRIESRWPELKSRLLFDLREVEDEMITEQANEKSRLKRSLNRRRIYPELRMSGRQDMNTRFSEMVTISPCVWILCGSQSCRKKVRRITDTLCLPVNLFEQRRIEVHVGAPEPHANQGFIPLSRLNIHQDNAFGLNYMGGTILHHLEAISPTPEHQSACGLLCCTTFVKDGNIITQHISRIGGLLKNQFKDNIVNRHPIALTTSHGIFEDLWTDGVEVEGLKDGEIPSLCDGCMDDEGTTSSDIDSDTDSLLESTTDTVPWRSSGQKGLGERCHNRVAEWLHVSSQEVVGINFAGQVLPEPISARVRRPRKSKPGDYTLLRSRNLADLNNTSSLIPEVEIVSYLVNSDLTQGPLTAVFGVGDLSETTLLPGGMMLPLGQEELPVRKIELVAPLAGTSGTWLIKDSALAGIIVAAYPGQPLALFVTAQDLRQNAVESFPEIRANFLRENSTFVMNEPVPNAGRPAAIEGGLDASALERTDGTGLNDESEPTSFWSRTEASSSNYIESYGGTQIGL
ncbi:hypothetical protein CTAM01_01094 [Colletotrichum tamarilloi]|uniref:Uncharacterized protein n=1 Tax=Colletotrichum tamarilloi TaxID=1209934 RepID=A0ABQ9RT51_9PEZI|nr:uncharacterized protein CTAM01_01094 [Colletotrichum tamarilloi]KAK1512164.1 hypothetical protein CTAM01_01094 [Colletotrichum tamarilloi]